MKKLLMITAALLLMLALVACGGGDTTTAGETTTTPVAEGTTTTPQSTTEDPSSTVEPTEGIDILNGELDNVAIKFNWKGMQVGAFENGHEALDYHWAYVVLFQESVNGIYEDLIWTPEGSTSVNSFEMNLDYKWVLTIDDVEYEITNFSVYNRGKSGFVRMDLGADFEHSTENLQEDGAHLYDIRLDIYDVYTDELVYFAYFTDPEWNGPHPYYPPEPPVEVDDTNRDPSHVLVEDAAGLEGPEGYNKSELYTNLFDYEEEEDGAGTKLCTNDMASAIIWEYDTPIAIFSYSLIGANDDEEFPERVLTNFKLYASKTGSDDDWVLIDEQSGAALTSATNYAERNFKIADDKVDMYSYFKLVPTHETMYQLSGIKVFTVN